MSDFSKGPSYVDDLVIRSRDRATLLDDLAEAFNKLHATRMKLNPEKCVFGVPSGKLLGFLVSSRGSEANLEKIDTIDRMRPPARLKDVQRLTGCMAALGRFISKLGERGLPLFKLLKRTNRFEWTPEAERALQDLKIYLTHPPVLVTPKKQEPLLLYISTTPGVVSAVLVVKREPPHPVEARSMPQPTGVGRPDSVDPSSGLPPAHLGGVSFTVPQRT